MKENTGTIIAMLEELLTLSKSRQASQSGSTNAANMDIAPIRALIKESNWQNRKYEDVRVETLVKICNVLNCDFIIWI